METSDSFLPGSHLDELLLRQRRKPRGGEECEREGVAVGSCRRFPVRYWGHRDVFDGGGLDARGNSTRGDLQN